MMNKNRCQFNCGRRNWAKENVSITFTSYYSNLMLILVLSCCSYISTLGQTFKVIHIGKAVPGASARIICQNSIENSKDPLFVINGRPASWNDLSYINFRKVVSIQVLKDSDAIFIYGTRAANGVVILRTADTLPVKLNAAIYIPGEIDSIFKGKAFWGYSISRVGTAHDSLHFYSIELVLTRHDSTGKIKPFEKLRAPGAIIFCKFRENGVVRKIPFIWQDGEWFADFAIHSDQPLSIAIVSFYRNEKKIMHAVLNKGIYPGEPD